MGNFAKEIISHFSLDGIIFTTTIVIEGKVILTEKHTDCITLAYNAYKAFIDKELNITVNEDTQFSLENGSIYINGEFKIDNEKSISSFAPYVLFYYNDIFSDCMKRLPN